MSQAVITWLESPAGQRWSAEHHGWAPRHCRGVFADIKEDGTHPELGYDAYTPRWQGRVFRAENSPDGVIRVIPGFPRNLPSPG